MMNSLVRAIVINEKAKHFPSPITPDKKGGLSMGIKKG
jgi:hypothetical protein